ncbi:MAG: hypothetical protein HN509_13480 [Halobacteriovoraceae bacterium]|jgi:hypothetical protein|nr:hypothetical protein [Halobacteriovoraceae bacterium]MBT5092667.1 hypothetical protein [Halobacteriovoraceae bacterium]
MEKSSSDNYIFFLKLSPKLPSWYFTMSTIFSHFNIKLLPITLADLSKINANSGKMQYIISLTPDMASYQVFSRFREKYLDFALKNNRFCLFDISSFGKIDLAYKIEKKKTYFYFQLPLEIGRICASITEAYFHHANDHQIWPGGRKSKLPTSTGVN